MTSGDMFGKKLGFGLMRLPRENPEDFSRVDLETFTRMTDIFMERGFSYFDTAYVYHGGTSETAVAHALSSRYPRDSFTLTDKLPILKLEDKESQQKVFDEQLERCGVDHFDIYLIHNLGEETYPKAEAFGSFDFLEEKRKEGRTRYTGFSFHHNAALLDEILTAHPEVDFVQLQVNYLDWDNEGIQSRKCCETARRHGKPIIIMEPVKGGTLANVPPKVEAIFREHAPDRSASSWAIRFAASQPGVVMTLSGMSEMPQLLDNLSFMQDFAPLSEVEQGVVERASRILAESAAIPCTACHYCADACPRGIPIAEYFSLYNTLKLSTPAPLYAEQVYYENYTKKRSKASDCAACGACVPHCPQRLNIPEAMKEVAGIFES